MRMEQATEYSLAEESAPSALASLAPEQALTGAQPVSLTPVCVKWRCWLHGDSPTARSPRAIHL